MLNAEASKLTSDFLCTLSQRLSSRTELKNVEYDIEIGDDFVHMNPVVYVFPDTHHRKDSDKQSVLQYLVNSTFTDLYTPNNIVNDTIKIKPSCLIQGKYKYRVYTFANRRKWVKLP